MPRIASQENPYAKTFGDYLRYVRTMVFKESLRTFAKRLGLSPGYIGRLELAAVGIPRRDTIILIADGLGQPTDVWLAKAGYAPAEDPRDAELDYLTLKLHRLSAEQIDTVNTLIDGLVAVNETKGSKVGSRTTGSAGRISQLRRPLANQK